MKNISRNLTMLCDYYELTMANGYFLTDIKDKTVYFDVFYRNNPDNGGYAIDLDLKKDFFDKNHVNYYGAEKYTDVLAAYLNEHFDLPDRRNDEAAKKNWDGVYDILMEDVREYEKMIGEISEEEMAKELALEKGAAPDDSE